MKTSALCYSAALAAAAWTCAQVGASEPASEIRVVYPASATSREPMLADGRNPFVDGGGKNLTAKPPVKENGRLEIETPLGQIREVRETLDAIRHTQTELAQGIETLVSRPPARDRADEILAAIERASAARAAQEAQPSASDPISTPEPIPTPEPAPTLSPEPVPAPQPSEPGAQTRIDAGTWRAVFAALAVWLALTVLVKLLAKARTASREIMRALASGRAEAESKGDAK